MKKTPRVPSGILCQIQRALVKHYPEYSEPIMDWYSANPLPHLESSLTFVPIHHYSEIFEEARRFLGSHPHDQCMILTFSSAITVRGSMGDLSRFRQFLVKEGIEVNRNYKSMEEGKLFLSTANSSKGLERPFVLVALTFPLEMAFANFSNDLVVNLVSVALSRCKESVRFCVPVYDDRFSDVLRLYPNCPLPTEPPSATGRQRRSILSTAANASIGDFLERSHSATEILRQSILSFETRSMLRASARLVENPPQQPSFPPGERIRWTDRNEEEGALLGVLFEVLLTALWTRRWPFLNVDGMSDVIANPMYLHCRGALQQQFRKLVQAFRVPFSTTSPARQFQLLLDYTHHHLLISQKIRVRISHERHDEILRAWIRLQPDLERMRPAIAPALRPQVNLSRPFMTGIADLFHDEGHNLIYEIKTGSGSDWREDAFTQAALYMAMMPTTPRGTIRLLNPFRRELSEYSIAIPAKVLLRLDREMLLWNTNCFLAKYRGNNAETRRRLDSSALVCIEEDQILEWLAPTHVRMGDPSLALQDSSSSRIIVVRLREDDPILAEWAPPMDMMMRVEWMLEKIGFQHNDEIRFTINWSDAFSRTILLACFLKTHCDLY